MKKAHFVSRRTKQLTFCSKRAASTCFWRTQNLAKKTSCPINLSTFIIHLNVALKVMSWWVRNNFKRPLIDQLTHSLYSYYEGLRTSAGGRVGLALPPPRLTSFFATTDVQAANMMQWPAAGVEWPTKSLRFTPVGGCSDHPIILCANTTSSQYYKPFTGSSSSSSRT